MGVNKCGSLPQGIDFILKVAKGIRSFITVGVVRTSIDWFILITVIMGRSRFVRGRSGFVRGRCRFIRGRCGFVRAVTKRKEQFSRSLSSHQIARDFTYAGL